MFRTYNEFYILLEQIYANYNEKRNECDNNDSRNDSPDGENDENDEEGECIELDTFERTDECTEEQEET